MIQEFDALKMCMASNACPERKLLLEYPTLGNYTPKNPDLPSSREPFTATKCRIFLVMTLYRDGRRDVRQICVAYASS